MSMIRFRREKDAYAHLIHYGVCESGSVPRCYGWLELSRSSCDNLYDFSLATKDQDDFLRISLKKNRRRPKALLLEYLSPVERLSVQNITPTIADTALRALCTIHSAFVRHGDIETRNILLLPEGRVVWVDFDNAKTPLEDNPTLTRQMLMDELADGWSLFYTSLVSVVYELCGHCKLMTDLHSWPTSASVSNIGSTKADRYSSKLRDFV